MPPPQFVQFLCRSWHLINWRNLFRDWVSLARALVLVESRWFLVTPSLTCCAILPVIPIRRHRFFLQLWKILTRNLPVLLLDFKQVGLLPFVVLLSLLVPFVQLLDFGLDFLLLFFKQLQIIDQVLVDIVLEVFLLVLFYVTQTFDFFHRFVNDSVQLRNLVLSLFHFCVSDLDLLPRVELLQRPLVHVNLPVPVLQLSSQRCRLCLLLLFLLHVLFFVFLLLLLRDQLLPLKLLCQFLINLF